MGSGNAKMSAWTEADSRDRDFSLGKQSPSKTTIVVKKEIRYKLKSGWVSVGYNLSCHAWNGNIINTLKSSKISIVNLCRIVELVLS